MVAKILIVRFSSIGDIVLTTPVVRVLKHDAQAEVHFITKKKFVDVLSHNPNIDKVYTFENEITEVLSQLKSENYDYLIDLHKNLRSARLKNALNIPSRTFNKLNVEKWLRVVLKFDILPKIHIVERYFEAIKFLNLKYDGQGLDYFITDKDRKALEKLPESHQKGYHVFVIGGAHYTKQIIDTQLIELAKLSALPVVLLGGKADIEKANSIEKAVGEKVFNATGKFSLNESAALLEKAQKVITSDTGLMHIAAAFHKEIISFWGNTIPKFGMYPLLPKGEEEKSKIMEVEGLRCRPCSKIGYNRCPKGHFKCMVDIDLKAVWK